MGPNCAESTPAFSTDDMLPSSVGKELQVGHIRLSKQHGNVGCRAKDNAAYVRIAVCNVALEALPVLLRFRCFLGAQPRRHLGRFRCLSGVVLFLASSFCWAWPQRCLGCCLRLACLYVRLLSALLFFWAALRADSLQDYCAYFVPARCSFPIEVLSLAFHRAPRRVVGHLLERGA